MHLNFSGIKELNYLVPSTIIDRASFEIYKNIILADPTFDRINTINGIIDVGLFFKLLYVGQI